MAQKFVITADIRAVLDKANIGSNYVKLPQIPERKLYLEVNNILQMAGGRWDTKQGRHVFDNNVDPRESLGMALSYVEGDENAAIDSTARKLFTVVGLFADGRRYCSAETAENAGEAEQMAVHGCEQQGKTLIVAAVIEGIHRNVAAPEFVV